MKNLAILFLLVVSMVSPACFGQTNLLSKKQMQADIDTIESIVRQYYYGKSLLEKRTKEPIEPALKNLENSITNHTTLFNFVDIVRQGLNLLNDGHTEIANKSTVKWYLTSQYSYLSKIGNALLADTLNADMYRQMMTDSIFAQSKSGLRAKYINGKYYNARPFTFNGDTIKVGDEISTIEGIDINSFVQQNHSKMFFLMWDSYNDRWYSDSFYMVMPLFDKRRFAIEIGSRKVIVDSDKRLENLQKEQYSLYTTPKAYVLNDILYLYIPSMMNSDWYVQQIRTLYSSKIKKVVLDIRGNGGGDDGVWFRILENLIDRPLTYKYSVGMNCRKEFEGALSAFGKIKVWQRVMKVSGSKTIYPDSASIKFCGKIYVLQDKYSYSAAAALVSVAMQNKERMAVIGERSALISGYTFPALLFILPNSRIAFKLGFSADLSGGIDNPYMDKVDVDIQDSIFEYLEKRYKYDCHSEEYLNNKDRMIRYVRER